MHWDLLGILRRQLLQCRSAGETQSHHHTASVNSLSAIEVKGFTYYLNAESPFIIGSNKKHFACAARYMKGNKLFFH